MIVDKFAAAVGIKATDGERQRLFDIFCLFKDTRFAFAPNGPLFGPLSGNIVVIDSKDILAFGRFTAMMNGIRFNTAGIELIPLIGFNGDLFA